tara:strand:+ start:1444 stop:3027 length:1584 start_codon:yes stop_codon:yes gene_type:complete
MKSAIRNATLLIILFSGPILWIWIAIQGLTFLNWLLVGSIILWGILLAVWYLCFGKAPFKKRGLRVGLGLIGAIALVFTASSLLRYEGSSSGSSAPKFSWVWQNAESHGNTVKFQINTADGPSTEELQKASADLNQFFGPARDATWSTPTFSSDWVSTPPQLVWRRSIGTGWSSFTVRGKKALTHEQNGDDECVTCLDLFTGETLWQHRDKGVRLVKDNLENPAATMGGDGPRSTPTLHDGRAYALGSTGIVNCLDIETGKVIWTRNVISEFDGRIHEWGLANAPLILPEYGTVVIPGSDRPGTTLVAFDLESGEDVWTYQGQGASYSSPRLLNFFDTTILVCVNNKDATGHDPATGEALWTYPWPGDYPRVGQPLKVGEDRLLMSASYGMGTPLLELRKSGDQWSVKEIWKSTRLKTKFSSAALLEGYAYGLDEGRLACIDLKTGDKVWKNQKFGFGQHLLFGDQLLVQTEDGPVVCGQIDPKGFTETGRIEDALSSMTWNAPAVAGRLLLIRNDKEAACYLLPSL